MAIIEKEEIQMLTKFVICDFESAPMTAAKEFMDVEIFGCFFHFSQALIRNFNSDLRNGYDNSVPINLRMKEVFALAYVDPENIQTAYDLLKPKLQGIPGIDSFLEYFEKTWIGLRVQNRSGVMVKRQPKFHPKIWSVYHRTIDGFPNTTNFVEAWNGRFKRLVGRNHVGIFELIKQMKEEQRIVEGKIEKLEAGRIIQVKYESQSDRIYRIISDPPQDLEVYMSSCAKNL